jgi:chromosome segregation ATPase
MANGNYPKRKATGALEAGGAKRAKVDPPATNAASSSSSDSSASNPAPADATELEGLRARIAALEGENALLLEKTEEQEEEIAQLRRDNEQGAAVIIELRSKITDQDDKLGKLRGKVHELRRAQDVSASKVSSFHDWNI